MKLVAYVRSSGLSEESLDAQEGAIRAWAEAAGHQVTAVEADDGVSGTRESADREGLAAALLAVREGGADGIAVHRIDRLSRKLTVQEAVLAEVWKTDGHALTSDTGEIPRDDPDDPYRTFVRQVMGAAAQLERGLIVARMQSGRRRKRTAGGYIGGVPYGYRLKDGLLLEVPAELATAALVRRLHKRGRGLRAIARELDRRGVPSRTGARWQHTTVRNIVAARVVRTA